LRKIGVEHELCTPFLDGLLRSNLDQNRIALRKLLKYFKGDLKGKKIAVLGLTYKPDTSTLRRSASIEIIKDLNDMGAQIYASDPKADRSELEKFDSFKFYDDYSDAIDGVDAVILVTPWSEYKKINLISLEKKMRGKLIFDAASIFNEVDIVNAGLHYMNIGSGSIPGEIN
jgi:UDPglucose 6-dehydrogenase